MPLKTLFLNPPSFEGFDGGAGSRWPATREIESYWYPVWLTYPAGMLEGSRLLDAPPHHISAEETIKTAQDQATSTAGGESDEVRLTSNLRPFIFWAISPAVLAMTYPTMRDPTRPSTHSCL